MSSVTLPPAPFSREYHIVLTMLQPQYGNNNFLALLFITFLYGIPDWSFANNPASKKNYRIRKMCYPYPYVTGFIPPHMSHHNQKKCYCLRNIFPHIVFLFCHYLLCAVNSRSIKSEVILCIIGSNSL